MDEKIFVVKFVVQSTIDARQDLINNLWNTHNNEDKLGKIIPQGFPKVMLGSQSKKRFNSVFI